MPRGRPRNTRFHIIPPQDVIPIINLTDVRMTLFELGQQLRNFEDSIALAAKYRLIANSRLCQRCGNPCYLSPRGSDRNYADEKMWRCSNQHCQQRLSIRHNSFFEGSRLPIQKILVTMVCWSLNCTQQHAMMEARLVSNNTVIDWYNFCRDMCLHFDRRFWRNRALGGPGTTVELDESWFYKRKYHRGRGVLAHQLVFGMIERQSRKVILIPIPNRRWTTLRPIIMRYIRPGTRVMTDAYRAYVFGFRAL